MRTIVVAGSLALLTLAATASAAPALKLMHFFPATTLGSRTDAWFAEEVQRRTEGAVKVRIFWSGALGKATEVLDLVGSGAVEMGATLPNYFPAQLPFASVGAVPLGYFPDAKTALAVERAVVDEDPAATAELRRANIEPIIVHGLLPYHLICSKPIARMADLQGTKVRTFGAYAPTAIRAVGAVPVNLQPAEIYEGLQRGTVDCVMYNYEFAASSRLHEVAKYWSTISFGSFSGYHVYINRDVMASLPAGVADTIRTVGRQAERDELQRLADAEGAALATAKAAGVTIVTFTEQGEFDRLLPEVLDQWASETVATGASVDDVTRVVATVRQAVGK